MNKYIKAFRCDGCGKIIDPEKSYYIKINSINCEVKIPASEIETKVSWRDDYPYENTLAACSENCLGAALNELAKQNSSDHPEPTVNNEIV